MGIYGREMWMNWYAMSAMLRSGLDITAPITHRLTAADWAEAYATASGGQCGKVVIDWPALWSQRNAVEDDSTAASAEVLRGIEFQT
jgi:hypothetical protein